MTGDRRSSGAVAVIRQQLHLHHPPHPLIVLLILPGGGAADIGDIGGDPRLAKEARGERNRDRDEREREREIAKRKRERAREIEMRGRDGGGSSSAAHGGGGPISLGSRVVLFSVQVTFESRLYFNVTRFKSRSVLIPFLFSSGSVTGLSSVWVFVQMISVWEPGVVSSHSKVHSGSGQPQLNSARVSVKLVKQQP